MTILPYNLQFYAISKYLIFLSYNNDKPKSEASFSTFWLNKYDHNDRSVYYIIYQWKTSKTMGC